MYRRSERCPHCYHLNPAVARHCATCGAPTRNPHPLVKQSVGTLVFLIIALTIVGLSIISCLGWPRWS